MPARMRLPFAVWVLHFEGALEPEVQCLDRLTEKKENAVDIGANIGIYSYRLSQLFRRVYSFEPDPEDTKDLRAYNPGNIELHHVGLSGEAGEAVLHVPVKNGFQLHGWASLQAGRCPDTDQYLRKTVPLKTLDSFELNAISLIKIDVEGHELAVLQGARQTIVRNQPGVLIEIQTENIPQALSFFREIGYTEQNPNGVLPASETGNRYFAPARGGESSLG